MEYSPPPFFKQGPSARARLLFFAALAVTLLVADARFNALVAVRRVIATALYPLNRVSLVPQQLYDSAAQLMVSTQSLREQNDKLAAENTSLASNSLIAQQLAAENAQLRQLIGMRERQKVTSIGAELLYDARDPSSRKIVIDRGSKDGVAVGSPVIDDVGVIGQATRVFPLITEVTLLTDKNQAIPVQNLRSGARAVAYGGVPGGLLELRFMASNADVQSGDMLVTSGIDGVYPSGLPVAKVSGIERNAAYAFARITCTPIGGTDRNRHVLVLGQKIDIPPPPPPEPVVEPRRNRRMTP
jgi:rod shape-determining protein MreC